MRSEFAISQTQQQHSLFSQASWGRLLQFHKQEIKIRQVKHTLGMNGYPCGSSLVPLDQTSHRQAKSYR